MPAEQPSPTTPDSLWRHTLPATQRFRADPLPGPRSTDVAIVGGGLTGLWTAYYLSLADPDGRIAVLDRDQVGHGASGRNGGWCSALLPMSLTELARRHGRGAAIRMQRAMHDTVDEVIRVCADEGIDADIAKGGTIDLIRSESQRRRADEALRTARSFDLGDDDLRWLDAGEARSLCNATEVLGALFTPHCAALHPARLVNGLAHVVAARGVEIHERTPVHRIEAGHVHTEHGTVTADVVVQATEGYSPQFKGMRRDVIPLYSMMIATEPLGAETWNEIGLTERPTFTDGRHSLIYGQRTADDRLAFGGRGAPYHFGSRVDPAFDTDRGVRDRLVDSLHELFPATAGATITHHWGGPLGVPRDFHANVRFDRRTGLATAGGYVGDGLATTNLAGRTLADLIAGHDSDLIRLPWVGHRPRKWEPEPLRWIGVNGVRLAAEVADRADRRAGGPSRIGRLVDAVLRH